MADIGLNLDPRAMLDALNEMSEHTKKLAKDIEDSLGKDAVNAVKGLEEEAEKGTSKISQYFGNLGKRVKEDLKTAFDATGILAGAKFAKELGAGVKSVFDMERAFDRLNTRLGMTGRYFQDFKKNVGSAVANTGQRLEDVLPGVESASSRGGIKNAGQLTQIAGALAQARATTGEDTEGLSDTIIEILKTQGKKINAQSFKETLDALQGTRVAGAFKTAGEAGHAMEGLSPYAKQLGLGTRDLGGLAAVASQSGSSGQDILKQIMERGTTVGGQQQLNAVLGKDIFKNGKLDAKALGQVDTKRFGNQQILSEASGLTGANGADLTRFVEAFKNGADGLKKVVSGADETATQFGTATDNLASGVDKFREKTIEAGREIGSSLSKAGNELLKGNWRGAGNAGMSALQNVNENKGTIAAALGTTALVGVLAGGGLKNLLGGAGGLAGGVLKGEAAKSLGIQPVYVVNASEMGKESVLKSAMDAGGKSALEKMTQMATGGGGFAAGAAAPAAGSAAGALGKFGGAAGAAAMAALPVAIAGAVGAGLGAGFVMLADKMTGGGYSNKVGKPGEWLADMMAGTDDDIFQKGADQVHAGGGSAMDPEAMAKAVEKGSVNAHNKTNAQKRTAYTNPSSVQDRGGGL